MSKKKLLALNHADPDNLNIIDEQQFRNTILWLEDQKIRHYKIDDRNGLRQVNKTDMWSLAFSNYLNELKCPYGMDEDPEILLDWLLGYATRLAYGDNLDVYLTKVSDTSKASSASNPLDNIDFDSSDVKAGVASLAHILQIPPHPDHLEVLKAICEVVRNRLSPESIEKAKKDIGKRDHLLLKSIQLGFDSGDYVSNDAAKVLRLLQVHNLRQLQTQINSAIVAVQAITGDPKTDTKLGKVGR